MRIDFELKQMKLPKVYQRNGRECFYDPYREKLVPITPEEIVRQKVLSWLVDKLDVHSDCIIVEQHLSHYGINSRDRADIVIHKYDENNLLAPIAVVECKADTVYLTHGTLDQCFKYADLLGISYAFITNGQELLSYRYDSQTDRYVELECPPNFTEMTQGVSGERKVYPPMDRPSFDKMKDSDVQKMYTDDFIFGVSTKPEMIAYCINLFECLMDTAKTLSIKRGKLFSVVEDLGVRISSYGNASGYDFVAPYRCFLIRDSHNNHQIVSFGFNAYGNDQTILCVAIDDFKKSHHALQLLIDRYAHCVENELRFTHTGRIAVGHSGSGSSKELLAIVSRTLPDICRNNELRLGTIPTDILLTLDHPAVSELFVHLIDYALLRDDYRNAVKGIKNTAPYA